MIGGRRDVFKDRQDSGRRLAAALGRYRGEHPVVCALPRGGVPVGYEVAVALEAPLDVVVVRKLGAPGRPELGIGAVVDGDHPERVLNEDVLRHVPISAEYVEAEVERQLQEIRRLEERYRSGRPAVSLAGRTAIVIDDGLATGGTMRAALRGVRRAGPRRVILAVPVAPPDTLEALRAEADEVVCLSAPLHFDAVGCFYEDFAQTTDDEVVRLLTLARGRAAATTSVPPARAT